MTWYFYCDAIRAENELIYRAPAHTWGGLLKRERRKSSAA